MGKIAIRNFTGEIPKMPTHLLPDTGAQRAVNCDFTHGDLRPLKTGKQVLALGFLAKAIYSDDGSKFVGFPSVAYAYKSPVIDDSFNRFYYSDDTGIYVSTLNDLVPNQIRKSTDISRKKVGVPKPKSVTVGTSRVQNALNVEIKYVTYQADTSNKLSEGVLVGSTAIVNGRMVFSYDLTQLPDTASVTVTNTGFIARLIPTRTTSAKVDAAFFPVLKLPFGDFPFSFGGNLTTTLNSVIGSVTITQTLNDARTYTVGFDFGTIESVVLAVTQTNQYGEESPPTLSNAFNVGILDRITVKVVPDQDNTYVAPMAINVYKSNSSGTGFVGIRLFTLRNSSDPFESYNGTTYTYNVLATEVSTLDESALGALQTTNNLLPPDGLKDLVLMPNGFFTAYKGNTLYFSEPFKPHTWQNSMTFPSNITGICLGEQQLVVTTLSNPYIVIGASPDAMTQQRLPDIQAGFTSRTMTNSAGLVAYVSRDGIVTVNGPTSNLSGSQALFTREDWRARYDAVLPIMQLTSYDGRLFAVNPTNTNGFLMTLDENGGNYTRMELKADGVFILPKTDSVYYSANNLLYEFGVGDVMTATWWSKEFILPRPSSFAAGFINSTGAVTVELFTDAGLFSTQVVTGRTTFRIPSGQPSRRWSIRLTTQAVVKEFLIAESMRDLQNG
jgi:hypothetical protein